jgi:xanthine dehydrogenase accessory factor
VAIASALGRHVIVAEDGATRDEFPSADAVVADIRNVLVDPRTAIVVATRGDHDEVAIEAALATQARYVGLVSSRTRGGVIAEMLAASGVSAADLARVHVPAGLDLGARSDAEIALTILSEILSLRGTVADRSSALPAPPPEAIDPICSMTVAITAYALSAVHEGVSYYFCGEGCRRRFLADPAAALASR